MSEWTPERIAELRAAVAASYPHVGFRAADASFLAVSRTALPAALDEIERLQARIVELDEMLSVATKAMIKIERLQTRVDELTRNSVDKADAWDTLTRPSARDQRREQLLRECEPVIDDAGWPELAARIRVEIGSWT